MERRFQPVTVVEPSVEDTIHVLLGIKSYYENYHRVQLSDDIIKRAVVLSERYITDRFLPDKAIDLMDESCACAALRNAPMAEYDTAKFELEKLREQEEEMTADGAEPDYENWRKHAVKLPVWKKRQSLWNKMHYILLLRKKT